LVTPIFIGFKTEEYSLFIFLREYKKVMNVSYFSVVISHIYIIN
jgi:hypothetical protein